MSANHEVVRWVLVASADWIMISDMVGTRGNTSIFLNGPIGVAVDPMSNGYVAVSNNHHIQLFSMKYRKVIHWQELLGIVA